MILGHGYGLKIKITAASLPYNLDTCRQIQIYVPVSKHTFLPQWGKLFVSFIEVKVRMFSFSCQNFRPNLFSFRVSPITSLAAIVATFRLTVAASAGLTISFRDFRPFLAGKYVCGSSRNE